MQVRRDYASLLGGSQTVVAMEILTKWNKIRSDNEELKLLTESVLGMITYINSLEYERIAFDHVTNQQNDRVLHYRQILEKKEEEINKLKENIEFLEELQR